MISSRSKFAIFTLAVAVASSSVSAQSLMAMQASAKKLFVKRLVDPDSLQFRNLKTVDGGAICGEYNAKNKMGGYNGFKLFIYDQETQTITTMDGNFYSDTYGDFSLKDFSSRKIDATTDIKAHMEEFKSRSEAYKANLMRCA